MRDFEKKKARQFNVIKPVSINHIEGLYKPHHMVETKKHTPIDVWWQTYFIIRRENYVIATKEKVDLFNTQYGYSMLP